MGGMSEAVPVRWDIAADESFRTLVASGRTIAEPGDGGTSVRGRRP